jgi:hypothetical protein
MAADAMRPAPATPTPRMNPRRLSDWRSGDRALGDWELGERGVLETRLSDLKISMYLPSSCIVDYKYVLSVLPPFAQWAMNFLIETQDIWSSKNILAAFSPAWYCHFTGFTSTHCSSRNRHTELRGTYNVSFIDSLFVDFYQ